MTGNYIKLDRNILDWEWYSNINTKILFLHCLLKANWKDGKFEGVDIQRGSFVTSLPKLSAETGLSVKAVRTALEHLAKTGEAAVKVYPKFRIVTVNNYIEFQGNGSQRAVKGQSRGSQRAAIEEKKESKKGKNKTYMCAFEEFWKSYPRKIDKGNAYKKFTARVNNGYAESDLITACRNYAAECSSNKTEKQFIKHPKTFLGDAMPFLDYLREEKPHDTGTTVERDTGSITDAFIGREFNGFD